MERRLNIITLGVADLDRSLHFYRDGLGWKPSSISNEHIAFFQLGAVLLALYPRASLAADAQLPAAGSGFAGFTLAQNVATRQAVDEALGCALAAGGTILKQAQEVFWGGYSGYFADPDGHAWEVAYNPFIKLDAAGRVHLDT